MLTVNLTDAQGKVLLTRQGIAARCGVKTVTVDKWRIRHTDFPHPVAVAGHSPLWYADQVDEWVRVTGR